MFFFKFNKSLRKILIINPVGVTTKKNTKPITNGETILPKNIPNLNQIIFNGFNKFEFNIPKIRNTNEIINDQILISWFLNNGQIAKTKKTTKKTIPKLLFELILIFLFFKF